MSSHRSTFTGSPETCACILREAWPDQNDWPKGQTLNAGQGRFCDFTTVLATRRGHLTCLKYAVENGCTMHHALTRETMDTSAQIECLKYALSLGLSVDVDALNAACRSCHPTRLELVLDAWLQVEENKQLFEKHDVIGHVCINAPSRTFDNARQCIEILRSRGASWRSSHMSTAIKNGGIQLVNYLLKNECPWPADALEMAVVCRNDEVKALVKQQETHLKHKRSLDLLFENVERNKSSMTEQEYIDACNAAQELHRVIMAQGNKA